MNKGNLDNWEKLLIAVVVSLGAFIRFAIAIQDIEFLVAGFLPDDAFYYFVVARNFVQGHGITFDGLLPTNGFHPLWLFLITPFFAFDSSILPIRLVLFLSILLDLLTGVCIYCFLKKNLKKVRLLRILLLWYFLFGCFLLL